MELFVEVRELAPGVLEKKSPADRERKTKQIRKENDAEAQNPGAVRVEHSRAFASISLPSWRGAEFGVRCVSESGRAAGRKGGPREERRFFEWQKSESGDVARARAEAFAAERRWRSEVGPTFACVRPLPLRCRSEPGLSLERLIFAEVGDGHSERIDGNQFIGNLGLENEYKVRGVEIAFQFAMVGRRVIDHIEVDARAERRRLHFFERNLLDFDIDFGRRGIREEFLENVVLAVGIENPVRELAVEEVQGFREVVLNGVAVAAVVEGAELGEKILGFGVLGLVFEVVIVDGFGASEIVDANHEGPEVLERANGFQID